MVKDPVCGMDVVKETAVTAEYKDQTYYFCCRNCKAVFQKTPDRYLNQ